jgi:hypothetical protein
MNINGADSRHQLDGWDVCRLELLKSHAVGSGTSTDSNVAHETICRLTPAVWPAPPLQVIPEGPDGRTCLASLEEQLKAHQHHPLRIGSFTAGSNVTGVCRLPAHHVQLTCMSAEHAEV